MRWSSRDRQIAGEPNQRKRNPHRKAQQQRAKQREHANRPMNGDSSAVVPRLPDDTKAGDRRKDDAACRDDHHHIRRAAASSILRSPY